MKMEPIVKPSISIEVPSINFQLCGFELDWPGTFEPPCGTLLQLLSREGNTRGGDGELLKQFLRSRKAFNFTNVGSTNGLAQPQV